MDTQIEKTETTENSPDTNARLAGWQFLGLLIITFGLGLGLGYVVWGYPLQKQVSTLQQTLVLAQSSSTQTAVAVSTEAANQSAVKIPDNVQRYTIPIDGDPTLGPENAPITLIEFSDYECPFCRKWQLEVFPQLQTNYKDKIRFVYKDFPLYDKHPDAEPAAIAANCAGAQNKYWEFHNLLFRGESLDESMYTSYMKQLGLDATKFNQCRQDTAQKDEIKADFDFASNLGISSTPTFFINGLAIVGAQPYSVFQQVIDLELAGKIPH